MEINDNNATQRYRQLAQEAHDDAMMYRGKLEAAETRIAELEREVEVHATAEEVQIALREKVQEERDAALEREQALAAHLEQLNYVIVDAKRCAAVLAFPSNYNATDYQSFAKDVMNNIEALSKQEPTATLDRRYKLKQAEAMERLADRKQRESEVGEDLSLRRKQAYAAVCAANECTRLRQQAEGGQ